MNGPDPVGSVICWLIGWLAMRAGIMKAGASAPASASSTRPKGLFSLIWKVRSSTIV
jgi:hypothetical protein